MQSIKESIIKTREDVEKQLSNINAKKFDLKIEEAKLLKIKKMLDKQLEELNSDPA